MLNFINSLFYELFNVTIVYKTFLLNEKIYAFCVNLNLSLLYYWVLMKIFKKYLT